MKRSRSGFTLLELLLAIVMSATIAGSLAVSMYVAYRARNAADRAITEAHFSDAVGDIVARDFLCALPPASSTSTTAAFAGPFTGQSDCVDFYASGNEPKAALQSDCRMIEYALADDDRRPGSTMLVRRVRANLMAPFEEDPTSERIFRDVESVSFLYYDGSSWQESWDSTQLGDILPAAVQISITFKATEDGTPRQVITRTIGLPCGQMTATAASGGTN